MKKSQKQALAAGAGAAALAAAVAGVYFLTGKGGAKNRKKLATLADRVKRDVVREINVVGKTGKAAYNEALATVNKRYKRLKNADPKELAAAVKELQGYWGMISRQVGTPKKVTKRAVKKAKSKRKAKRKARR